MKSKIHKLSQFLLYQINYFPVKEKLAFRHFLFLFLRIILWLPTHLLCARNQQDRVLSNPLPIISRGDRAQRIFDLNAHRKKQGLYRIVRYKPQVNTNLLYQPCNQLQFKSRLTVPVDTDEYHRSTLYPNRRLPDYSCYPDQ